MKKIMFTLCAGDSNRRIDRVIRKFLHTMPLSGVYVAIRKGLVQINGKKVVPHYITVEGDILTIADILLDNTPKQHKNEVFSGCNTGYNTSQNAAYTALPPVIRNTIPSIVVQTADILAVNKPAGIVVHGEAGLSTVLAYRCPLSKNNSLSFKQGPLHRLDKYTSGIICFSRSLRGAQWFSEALRNRLLHKYYLGIVAGSPVPHTHFSHLDLPVKQTIKTGVCREDMSITEYYPLVYSQPLCASLVLFKLITGKKHQIRKHMQTIGTPLLGDRTYGSLVPPPYHQQYALHAWRLYFPHNRLDALPAYLEAPFPQNTVRCITRYFCSVKKIRLLFHRIYKSGCLL